MTVERVVLGAAAVLVGAAAVDAPGDVSTAKCINQSKGYLGMTTAIPAPGRNWE